MSEFLKCDAVGCDHRETVSEITAEMIGTPCPKCGASLLTQTDWDFYSTVFKPGLDAIEKAMGMSLRAAPDTPAAEKISFNYHEGEIKIGLPPRA